MAAPAPGTPPYMPLTTTIENEQVSPILIGHLLSFGLFGVGVLQFYYVFRQLDLLRAQTGTIDGVNLFQVAMAALLFITDIADTITKGVFIDQFVRKTIVGGLASMEFLPRTAFTLCFSDGFIAFITHIIYIARLIRVNRSTGSWIWGVAALAMAISITQFVCAIVTGVRSWGPVSGWKDTVAVSAKLWLGGAGICDIILCVVFVFSIARHRTDFNSTNYIITRWIAFTLETGILTSALQIADLILFLVYPDRPYHLTCALILPKIYVISILIMLNTVYANRLNSLAGQQSSNYNMSRTSNAETFGANSQLGKRSVISGIQITSEVHTQQQDPDLARMGDVDSEKGFQAYGGSGVVYPGERSF